MKINEIFKSIQGEGKHSGEPVLFIRTSGCTRNCDFCDTQYHRAGKNMTTKQIVTAIKDSGMDTVVWTGGEPMMWYDEIEKVVLETQEQSHHIETNGDIIIPLSYDCVYCKKSIFTYIGISPKTLIAAKNAKNLLESSHEQYDIKVVTDLELNKDMIPYATILMPLSTYTDKDKKIQQDVWEYCIKNKLKYCHRVHVDVWGQKVGK